MDRVLRLVPRVGVCSLAIVLLLVGLSAAFPAARASSGSSFAFTNYELGSTTGQTCPSGAGGCANDAAEPQIRADASGSFYASSETSICFVGTQNDCGGTFAWRSIDGGLHYATLPSPNRVTLDNQTVSPAGGDTDLALAPARNALGYYNVYVASLVRTPPLADIFVSSSHDGGQTWFVNPVAANLPVDDREWVAADGASKVCLSYHAIATTDELVVECSYDGGLTFPQTASAFDANHQFLAGLNNQIGSLAIDPNNHVVYQSFAGIASAADLQCDATQDCLHAVWLASSLDGGLTFTDHLVYVNPSQTVTYDHQFTSVAVDRSGNVYDAFTDNHNTYLSVSTDFGQTWSAPAQVNSGPANTAIFPWVTAGSSGQVDVVFYGTSYYDGVNVPDSYPMSAAWYVYFAQNLNAVAKPGAFTQVDASPIIHFGGVCEAGVTCTGNRDLLDDFGVAASPTTGLASIVYSDDQYTNTTTDAPATFDCTANTSNSDVCDHTEIATQTAGSGIFGRHKGFDIDRAGLNLQGTSFTLGLSLTNTATVGLTGVSVSLSEVPMSLGWDASFPIASGATVDGQTTAFPLGVVLSVGSIYTLTVTASFADGSTVTETMAVIGTSV